MTQILNKMAKAVVLFFIERSRLKSNI